MTDRRKTLEGTFEKHASKRARRTDMNITCEGEKQRTNESVGRPSAQFGVFREKGQLFVVGLFPVSHFISWTLSFLFAHL